MRVVAVWLALLGCGSESALPLEDSTQSGTRLRVHWVQAGDESARHVGDPSRPHFFDSELGVECTPVVWSDGVAYCTPSRRTFGYGNAEAFGRLAYKDPQCTQLLLLSRTSLCPPQYAAVDDFGFTALYEMGPQSTVTNYYVLMSGICVGPGSTGDLYSYFEPGPQIVREQLAPMSVSSPRGAGRLRWRYIESSDGLAHPISVYDTERGVDCSLVGQCAEVEPAPSSESRLSPTLYVGDQIRLVAGGLYDRDSEAECRAIAASDGTVRCFTSAAVLGRAYTDQTCQTPVDIVGVVAGGTPPPTLVQLARDRCEPLIEGVFALGGRFAGTPYEKSGAGTCIPFQRTVGDMPVRYDFYVAGMPLGFDAIGPVITPGVD